MKEQSAYLLGSFGISLGLLTLGQRVMETVGKKVVKLDFAMGFCAQFASAIAVILGTLLGMPLSTTHCMVGALFGIILAKKVSIVKNVYPEVQSDGEKSIEDATGKSTVLKIVIWWLATVPVAMGLTMLIELCFKRLEYTY